MSTTTTASVPPASTAPRLTAEEFVARHQGDRVELVKGVVKEPPMPWPRHGFICSEFAWLLRNHLAQHDLGRIALRSAVGDPRRDQL